MSDEKWLMMEETLHIPVSPAPAPAASRGHLAARCHRLSTIWHRHQPAATSLLPPATSFLLRVSLNVVQDTLVLQIFDRMSLCLLKGFAPSNKHVQFNQVTFSGIMPSNIIKKKKTQFKLKFKYFDNKPRDKEC